MILLNFSHPLTDAQIDKAESMLGQAIERVLEVPVQLEASAQFEPQIRRVIEETLARLDEGLLASVICCLPGHSEACAVLLAEWHGRFGAFPSVLRRCPVENSTPTRFEVAEIINLQSVRDRSRPLRWTE